MKVEKSESFYISDDNIVTVKESGNFIKIRTMTSNTVPHIQKINAEEYIHLNTGEIKEFNHNNTKRTDNETTLKQTFSNLRDIINTNVINPNLCRFVTLTYKENMKDTVKLKKDLKKYHQRFSYYCKTNGIIPPEYITVIEPQNRGAWHAHIIYIFKKKAPFISNEALFKIWGNGFVNIKKVDGVDNVGTYLTAYLTDVAFDELADIRLLDGVKERDLKVIETTDKNGNNVSKSYIKGLRLKMYPKGMRIFRCSKGIKKPNIYKCKYGTIIKKLSDAEKTFEKTIALIDEEDTVVNQINYQHFKKNC